MPAEDRPGHEPVGDEEDRRRNDDRQEERLLAADAVKGGGQPHDGRLVGDLAGEVDRHPAEEELRRKGDDEGRHLQLHDGEPVDRAHRRADGDHHDDRQQDGKPRPLEGGERHDVRPHHAREREHRRGGEVEAAVEHRESHAQRDDQEIAGLQQQVLEVVQGCEVGDKGRRQHSHGDDDQQDGGPQQPACHALFVKRLF